MVLLLLIIPIPSSFCVGTNTYASTAVGDGVIGTIAVTMRCGTVYDSIHAVSLESVDHMHRMRSGVIARTHPAEEEEEEEEDSSATSVTAYI